MRSENQFATFHKQKNPLLFGVFCSSLQVFLSSLHPLCLQTCLFGRQRDAHVYTYQSGLMQVQTVRVWKQNTSWRSGVGGAALL